MRHLVTLIILMILAITASSQNDPVALNDNTECISQQFLTIDVLLNDYDPDGNEFYIETVKDPEHGMVTFNDSLVFYRSDPGFTGLDSMRYRIEDTDGDRSDYAWIFITVSENPDIPDAVNDDGDISQLVPTEIDVLANDSDPNGDELIIYEVSKESYYTHFTLSITEDSGRVVITSSYPLTHRTAKFKYRIKEKNTPEGYISEWANVLLDITTNPDIPTAIPDQANVVGGEEVYISVLNNDNDPTGNGLEIYETGNPALGTVVIAGDQLVYTADFSAQGTDQFFYKARNKDLPYLWSSSIVEVNISPNPGLPVAVDDQGTGTCGEVVVIDVLANDYDPDGAELEIMDAELLNGSFLMLEAYGNSLYVTPEYDEIMVNIPVIELRYRVREVNDTNSYSGWGNVHINMTLSQDHPIFEDDFASTTAGYPIEIDIFANDDFNGNEMGNILVSGSLYGAGYMEDVYTFTPYMGLTDDTIQLFYQVFKAPPNGYYARANIDVAITPNHSYDSLDLNNINAGIRSDGHLFNSYNEVIDYGPDDFQSHFEYPKGSGHHTIFTQSFWIGGLDASNQLHLAAQRYKQVGYDFQFGPVANDYSGMDYFAKYSRVWKLTKEQVTYHMNNYWQESYEPIAAIETWPGNGNTANGEAEQLAPYFDLDANGFYDPMAGDYPLIRGDQCILFIFNDDRIHTETSGEALKVELHGMAYAYDQPDDSLLNKTVFIHYDIYNRSGQTYSNTYFGLFTDFDIGYAWDDFVGCNVELGSYYGYNGTEYDGSGEPEAYGLNPPVQSVTVIAGPFMDDDGEDNPAGGCDHSINGLNFGDGVVDNERYGLTRFTYHANSAGATGDPNVAAEYYNYLRGFWKDNTAVLYGGNGHFYYGAVGPECRFMFPGASDPCNWGTDGAWPNGGYNQGGKYWTEEEVGNAPYDKRGLGVSGPFTFEPGEREEVELAFSVGRGAEGPASGMQDLFNNLATLFDRVNNGEIIIPAEELAVNELDAKSSEVKVYPNPARDIIHVTILSEDTDACQYCIYNNLGVMAGKGYILPGSTNEINIKNLESGFYIIKVIGKATATAKFIKH